MITDTTPARARQGAAKMRQDRRTHRTVALLIACVLILSCHVDASDEEIEIEDTTEVPDTVTDNKPAIPEYKPEIPEYRPELPEYRPEIPDYRPVVPVFNPGVPEHRPDLIGHNPNTPEYRPPLSEHLPGMPEYRPTVVHSPDLTGHRPVIPELRPDVPEYRPVIPEYIPMPEYPGIPTPNDTNIYIRYLTHPPEITIRPRNLQVRANGIAAFYCAARGDPIPNIQWRKNGKRVSSMQSRYLVSSMDAAAGPAANGAVLRIEPVRAQRDDATYECVAENGVGDAVSAVATLTVFEADKVPPGFPSIAPPPSTMVVEVGHTATLPCQAAGSPTPRVKWLWNSLPLDVASNPRYALLNDKMHGTLQIVKSEQEDQGKFECVAENAIGTEFSKPTSLYVKVRRVAPQFSIPPPPRTEVMLGGNLTLKCVAFGSPMPTVKWRKGLTQWLTPEDNPPLGLNVLKLEDIRESANYTCEAASVLSVIEATSEVKVQSLPGPPTEVRASEITATTVRLAWTYSGPEEPQYYVIQYKPKYANQAFSEISGVITQYYSVTNLSPYTEYEMYVIAVNNIGRGPPSSPAVITTGETGAKPGSAPRNVQVRPLSSSTMVIQWDEPETPNGQVTGYKIYYTTDPSQPLQSWHSQMMDNSHLTTISELTPHTVYTIRVQAFTSVGPGPISAPVQVKTQQGVPSQPSNLVAVEAGETSVTLSWRRPSHAGDNIVSYELYWNDTYAKEHHRKRIPITETYTLNGLYPNTLYYIWLAARSQRGEGATTPPIAARTKQYGMLVKSELRVAAVRVSRWKSAGHNSTTSKFEMDFKLVKLPIHEIVLGDMLRNYV